MQVRHYNEIRPRGTTSFPMELYHISASHPRYVMDLHWHVEWELIRILSGSLILTLDTTEYTATAGEAFWLNAGILHAAEPVDCVYECLVFDPTLLPRTMSDGYSFVPQEELTHIVPNSRLPMQDESVRFSVQALFETMRVRDLGHELSVQGSLLLLMGRILALQQYTVTPKEMTATAHNIARVKEVLHFIEDHFAEPLTLSTLSRRVGMTSKYFCRFFREMTGRTPIDYLNYYRIERASFLLIASDDSVTEIAYTCGFNDLSYFIRTFRRYMGVSPTAYVQMPRTVQSLKSTKKPPMTIETN